MYVGVFVRHAADGVDDYGVSDKVRQSRLGSFPFSSFSSFQHRKKLSQLGRGEFDVCKTKPDFILLQHFRIGWKGDTLAPSPPMPSAALF